MNDKYILDYNFENYDRLDKFALLMCQAYNFNNFNDWFGAFRGGLYGFYSRMDGLKTHYFTVHAWLPQQRSPNETEYHLASMFFNMDSAIECLFFSLNALGNALDSKLFQDISNENKLRNIRPANMIGNISKNNCKEILPGYVKYFPNMQSYWKENKDLLSIIIDQHDVSKHRETIFIGGMTRQDIPDGFFELLGINDEMTKAMFHPMAQIILQNNPKRHRLYSDIPSSTEKMLLENLVPNFYNFINKSGELILKDTKANTKLKHEDFIDEKNN